jgi:hypothetical protein
VHDEYVWHVAFGSNMDLSKLTSRHPKTRPPIVPVLPGVPAAVPGWALGFDVVGVAPFDPAVAAAVPDSSRELHGVLYKLSREGYMTLSISEGCCSRAGATINSAVYREVAVDAVPYVGHELVQNGSVPSRLRATIFALRKAPVVRLAARHIYPSQRYVSLLIAGAKAADLEAIYVNELEQLPTCRTPGEAMTGLSKLLGYGYFPLLKKPRLAAVARVLCIDNMTDAYSRREVAYLEGRLGLERFWNAVLVFYMLPLVCMGYVKAQTGRSPPPQRDNSKVRDK